MRLSTTTDALACLYGPEEALRRLAAIGFDAVDFSLFIYPNDGPLLAGKEEDFLAWCGRVKQAADAAGIAFGQVHSPMAGYPDTEEKFEDYIRLSRWALKAAGIFEAPYVVVHPVIWSECRWDSGHEENFEMNRRFYPALIETARENRTRIAVENMFNWDPVQNCICPTVVSTAEEMCAYIDVFNEMAGEETFVACLDVGHSTLVGLKPEEMVSILGKRLQVLHVQDTDGKHDLHYPPYFGGALNVNAFCRALRENHYEGTFSFESDCFIKNTPPSLWEDGLKYIHAMGRSLIAEITDEI